MFGCRQKTSALLIALFIGALWCSPARADQPKHKTHKTAVKQEAPPPQAAPAPPPPTPTPEQMPAVPAQVTYQNSQLTILARNSTLGDILRAVRKQTGANVDAPPNATQRVVGQFGPGPARDVLASVLDASDFNYVLLGSATNPNALERVIITAKSNAPANNAAPAPSADNNQAQDANESDDTDQGPPSESFVPQENQPDNQVSDDQNSQDQNQPPQKTPEQLLQELQRQQMIQQQQLQQQQQQQNQGGDSSQQPDQMHQPQR